MMSRVLIVHREAVQRHFLASFLEHEGFEVAQSATAEDACRLLIGQASIHAMLVDLDVSSVSGPEYDQSFRHAHDARFAGIPFLCMSSRLTKIEGERITAYLGGLAFVPPQSLFIVRPCNGIFWLASWSMKGSRSLRVPRLKMPAVSLSDRLRSTPCWLTLMCQV